MGDGVGSRLERGVECRDESPYYERPQTGGQASISSYCANRHPLSPDRQARWQGTCKHKLLLRHLQPGEQLDLEKIYLLTHILGTLGPPSGVPELLLAPFEDSRGS